MKLISSFIKNGCCLDLVVTFDIFWQEVKALIIKFAINKNNDSFKLNCPPYYPINNFWRFRAINIFKVIFIFSLFLLQFARDFLQEVEASHSNFVKLTQFTIFIDIKVNSATPLMLGDWLASLLSHCTIYWVIVTNTILNFFSCQPAPTECELAARRWSHSPWNK